MHRPHPPQRPDLGHTHCFRQYEIMGSQTLLYGAQPCDAGASSWSPPVLWRESWQNPLGICVTVHTCNVPKKGQATRFQLLQWVWVVSLRTSLFRTNWCHTIPSSICRHHWSKASIFHASVFEIAQQSNSYRKIGRMHVLYCFSCVEKLSVLLKQNFP